MGVKTVTNEFTSSIPPKRLFKAMLLESHDLLPKIAPHCVRSIEILEGNGGAGTVKQMNFPDGSRYKCIKFRIDELDENNLTVKYSLIGGDVVGDKLETVKYDIKFEVSGERTVCKSTSHYHTKGDVELKDEEIQAGKCKALATCKAFEDYLSASCPYLI